MMFKINRLPVMFAALALTAGAAVAQTSTGTGTDTGAVGTLPTPHVQNPLPALPSTVPGQGPAIEPPTATPPVAVPPVVVPPTTAPSPAARGATRQDAYEVCAGLDGAQAREDCVHQRLTLPQSGHGAGPDPLSPGSNSPGSTSMTPGSASPGTTDMAPATPSPDTTR